MQTCNITQPFVDEYEPRSGILAESEFSILSTTNRIKGYSPGQFIFGLDLILQIKHTVDWELLFQRKQTQINKYNICKNRNRVDHDYNVEDKVNLNNHTAYKYVNHIRAYL